MELSEEQNKLVDHVANENGFSDYQLIATPGSFKGDNFLGILTAITIKNSEKSLELILKSAHTNEAFRKAAPLHEAYEREIYLYECIFGEFKKFQDDYNVSDPFDSIPKAYAFSKKDGHECFIMENLKIEGYQLWDKKIPMNAEHVKAVLREYAKFHAISLAMKNKNPELFDELVKPISKNIFEFSDITTTPEKFNSYIKTVMSNGYKALEDDEVLTECLQRVETAVVNLFTTELKNPEYKLVVNHGDCWCNNFLFKYKDSNDNKTPLELRILDWQIAYLATPAHDFCYFLLVNSSKEILDNYKTYVEIYYDTLCAQLRKFNCVPEEIFPFSTFEHHLKKFMIFGLYASLMLFKIMICDSDEAPDFAEFSEKNGDIFKAMEFQIKNSKGYKERITHLIQFIQNNNFV